MSNQLYHLTMSDARRVIYLARINYKGLAKHWRSQARMYLWEARRIREGYISYD